MKSIFVSYSMSFGKGDGSDVIENEFYLSDEEYIKLKDFTDKNVFVEDEDNEDEDDSGYEYFYDDEIGFEDEILEKALPNVYERICNEISDNETDLVYENYNVNKSDVIDYLKKKKEGYFDDEDYEDVDYDIDDVEDFVYELGLEDEDPSTWDMTKSFSLYIVGFKYEESDY